jgi:hypothetical protein
MSWNARQREDSMEPHAILRLFSGHPNDILCCPQKKTLARQFLGLRSSSGAGFLRNQPAVVAFFIHPRNLSRQEASWI